jgi:hypothetical protein
MLGRLPRFWLVALLGHELQLPTWLLVVLFFVLIGLVVLTTRPTSNSEAIAPVTSEIAAQPDPDAPTDTAEHEPAPLPTTADGFCDPLPHGKPTVG